MDIQPFGDFTTPAPAQAVEEVFAPLPTVKKWIPHMKDHGDIVYNGTGHFCLVLECEVNHYPRSLEPVFDALDRKQY